MHRYKVIYLDRENKPGDALTRGPMAFIPLSAGVVMDLLELAPVVDGDFIPDEPSRLFHNAAQFDYMAGVNSMDGHIFAGVDVPSINAKGDTPV